MPNIINDSPLGGLAKLKKKEEVVKKCESYEIYTLNNRLVSYKKISRNFILKVNAKFEDINKLYQSHSGTDKEYLKYYCSDILKPIIQKWIATNKLKQLNEFLYLLKGLDKNSDETQVITKDIYKYLVSELMPFEQKYFNLQ